SGTERRFSDGGLSLPRIGRLGVVGPSHTPAAAPEPGGRFERNPGRRTDGAAMSLRSGYFQLIVRFGIGALFLAQIGGCAWIPSGGQRAEYLKPPGMAHKLSEARDGEPLTAGRLWPKENWWRQFGSSEL